jgi:hypothetical protein
MIMLTDIGCSFGKQMIRDLLIKLLFKFKSEMYSRKDLGDSPPDLKLVNKKGGIKLLLFSLVSFLSISILTYTLPENIQDKFPMLKSIVDIMADTFPSVSNFGMYSSMPQISQLVYSLGIIVMPVMAIILNGVIFIETPSRLERMKRSPILSMASLVVFMFFLIIISLYLFPGDPRGIYMVKVNGSVIL